MLNRIAIYAGLVGLVPGASLTPSAAQVRALDRLVPTPCLLYVSLDVPALLDGLSRSPLKSVWEASGMEADWQRATDMASEALSGAMSEVDFEPNDLAWLFEGEIAFALGGIDATQRDADGDAPFPSATLLADAGPHAEQLDGFLRRWVASLRAADDSLREEDYRGVTLYTTTVEEAERDEDIPFAAPRTLCLARIDSVFLLAFDEETARRVIGAATGAADVPTLAADSDYRSIRERTKRPESYSFYVDIASLLDTVVAFQSGDEAVSLVEDVVDIAGLSGLRGLGGGFSVREDGLWSEVFLLNPGPKQGLLWDLLGTSGATRPPSFLPADVASFQVGHVNFQSLFDNVTRLVEVVGSVDPTLPEDPLGDLELMLGFSLGDVLKSLDGEITYFASAAESASALPMGMSMGFTGSDVVLRLREMETLRGARVKVEELLSAQAPDGWPFEESEHLGRVLHVLKAGAAGEMPFTPAFTITDNLFAFSFQKETLQGLVGRLGASGGVAETPGFKRVAAYLPAEAGYYSYTSAAAVDGALSQMEMVLDMVAGMASPDQAEPLELATGLVPKLRTMVERFDGALGYSRVTPEGCAFTSGWLFAKQ